MTFTDDALDRLAPVLPWPADWNDVLRRAEESQQRRLVLVPLRRRRLVVALVVIAAVLIPLAAVAATNQWWFFESGNVPQPASGPYVVKEGDWSGHPWQLTAYPSQTDGLCFAITPKNSRSGSGAGMSCAPFAGIAHTAKTKASPDMTITYMAGSSVPGILPAHIVGPVIDKAVEVEIQFANGQQLSVPTFGAPAPLGHIRFYATQVPDSAFGPNQGARFQSPDWVAGLNKDGDIVACLATLTAKDGISPLSDCR